jgi:DNA-binding transcriptional ArsR family regulator
MLILEHFSAVPDMRVRTLPGVECCLALWAASAPEHEPMAVISRSIQEAMPDSAAQTLRVLNRELPRWPLWMTGTMLRLGDLGLDSALRGLAAEPPRQVAGELLLSALERFARDRCDIGADSFSAVVRSGCLPGDASRRPELLILRPEKAVMMIRSVLKAFCQAGYARLWVEQQPEIRAVSALLESRVALDPMHTLASVSPRVFHDAEQDRMLLVGGQEIKVVSCEGIDAMDIMPSMWLRRSVVSARTPTTLGLSLDCGQGSTAEPVQTRRMTQMLRALGDEDRFKIVCLCLERPRTTTELAPMLQLTEAPVSRHLKKLEQAGLIFGQRSGSYVTYTTAIEACHVLGAGIQRLAEKVSRQVADDDRRVKAAA